MNRRRRRPGLRLGVGLVLLGALAGGISREDDGTGGGRDEPPAAGERAPYAAAFGGYRTLAADLSWLRVYQAWVAGDPEAVRKRIGQTVALGPGESFFWREGARILAYDLPVWRAERASGRVSAAERQRWRREAAREALALLAEAGTYRPRDPVLLAEQGRLHWLRLGNPERAVEILGEAERLAGGDPRFRRWRILAEAEREDPVPGSPAGGESAR